MYLIEEKDIFSKHSNYLIVGYNDDGIDVALCLNRINNLYTHSARGRPLRAHNVRSDILAAS